MKTWVFRTGAAGTGSRHFGGPGRRGKWSIAIGLTIVSVYVCAAVFGRFGYDAGLYPYAPRAEAVNDDQRDMPPSTAAFAAILDHRDQKESDDAVPVTPEQAYHVLGTDADGRDVLIRVLCGAWTYLLPGLATVATSLAIGILIGSLAGYSTLSTVASVAIYFVTLIESFPRIVLLIGIAFLSDFSLPALVLALGLLNSARIAQLVRVRVATLVGSGFVEAAREMGLSKPRILLKHILWLNCRQALLVQIIYGYASLILVEATLMYFNSGLSAASVSWGEMIRYGMGVGYADKFNGGLYWQSVPPAAAIIVTLLGFNVLADGLERRYQIRGTDYR